MRKIVLSLNVTPDGFCDHAAVIANEELHAYVSDLVKNVDTILFGRVTYQLFESYWSLVARNRSAPKAQIEFADLIGEMEKIVFSESLKKTDWTNVTIIKEASRDAIMEIKKQPGKDILILGSPSVATTLSELGLIDEYYLLIQPMISGHGKRLFETTRLKQALDLKLTDIKTFDSGVVALCYQVKPNP